MTLKLKTFNSKNLRPRLLSSGIPRVNPKALRLGPFTVRVGLRGVRVSGVRLRGVSRLREVWGLVGLGLRDQKESEKVVGEWYSEHDRPQNTPPEPCRSRHPQAENTEQEAINTLHKLSEKYNPKRTGKRDQGQRRCSTPGGQEPGLESPGRFRKLGTRTPGSEGR